MEYHQGRREAIGIQIIFNHMLLQLREAMVLMGNQRNINRGKVKQ
jgi:hypothetical protein